MKDKLVIVDPVSGQLLQDRGGQATGWRSVPNADSIMIGPILSHARVVGSTPVQHLGMVDRHRTNVRCKQRGLCAIFRWYNNWANTVSCMFSWLNAGATS